MLGMSCLMGGGCCFLCCFVLGSFIKLNKHRVYRERGVCSLHL